MGTPSSNSPHPSHELLRKFITNPKEKITEEELHRTGLDVDILKVMFEQDIKPYLRYLAGMKRLGESDTFNEIIAQSSHFAGEMHLLREVQAVCLFDRVLVKESQPYCDLRIWLARSGTWIVWSARYDTGMRVLRRSVFVDGANETEALRQLSDIEALCEYLEDFFYKGLYIDGMHTREFPKRAPLILERRLRTLLTKTIEAREARLDTLKHAQLSAASRIESVRFAIY